MAASGLKRRVDELEAVQVGHKAYHCIIQRADQTEEEAVAAYEAENGPIGDDGRILRVIIRP